jgi:hypothetical protein
MAFWMLRSKETVTYSLSRHHFVSYVSGNRPSNPTPSTKSLLLRCDFLSYPGHPFRQSRGGFYSMAGEDSALLNEIPQMATFGARRKYLIRSLA